MSIFRSNKKIVTTLVASGLLAVAVIASLAFPRHTFAAGETYVLTLKNGNPNITVSGGNLKSKATLKYAGPHTYADSPLTYETSTGVVTYMSGCTFNMTISTNVLDWTQGTIEDASGGTCSKQVTSSYKGQTVPLQGSLANSGHILVTDISAPDQSNPPASETVTIKSSDGTKTYATETQGLNKSAANKSYGYFDFINPNNGATQSFDGEACSKVLNQCQKFHKDKGVTLTVRFALGGCKSGDEIDSNGACTTPDPSDSSVLDCGGGAMNWIVCPVISTAQKAAYGLDDWISSTLNAPIDQTFDSNYYSAWNSFRILATAIIVIAGLIMVVSQALGFEALDAYTVRKTLPRLLVAIIGISLSWPLMKFVVEFFNVFGKDVYGLITGPFMGVGAHLNPVTGGLITVLTPIAVGATLFIFGPAALLMILSGLIGLFMAFLILIIRQIGITVLIILAPIAIACYILPGTQKAWGLWRENFLGLLMMFPIVMAFIAGGHAFAAVSIEHGGGLSTIIGIIAYFIPYFLLPMAFKMATGAIGTISGMINDRSKGVFDRMKGFRQNAAQQRHQMRMAGQISKGRTGNLYRRLGSVSTPNSGALSLRKQGRANYAALRQKVNERTAAEALKNDDGRAAGEDIANTVAQMRDTTGRNFVGRYAQLAMAQAQARGETLSQSDAERRGRAAMGLLEQGYGAQMGSSAMKVAAFKAGAAATTKYAPGDYQAMADDAAAMVNAGLMTTSDAAAAFKGNAKRADMSGIGFGDWLQHIETARNGGLGGGKIDAEKMATQALQGSQPGAILAGHSNTVQALAPQITKNIQKAYQDWQTNTDPTKTAALEREFKQQAASGMGLLDVMGQVSPKNARILSDQFFNSQLPGRTDNLSQYFDQIRDDGDVKSMRREYASAAQADYARYRSGLTDPSTGPMPPGAFGV